MIRPRLRALARISLGAAVCGLVLSGFGCVDLAPAPGGNGDPDRARSAPYANTTDPTNDGATYIGSRACAACHPTIGRVHRGHGHAQALKVISGNPPEYPSIGIRAGVPDPPPTLSWSDIAYVVGGYTRGADFVDLDGFLITGPAPGIETRWQLDFPPNGTRAGFVPFDPPTTGPAPFDVSCFKCHATGARSDPDPRGPSFQDNRPGTGGGWSEPGVQCEACHGPGSKHIPNPAARSLFVGTGAQACGACHTRDGDPDVIQADGGFIRGNQQASELRASGGHADFDCVMCHAPHASTAYQREDGIRNECTACHFDRNMAIHDAKVFRRDEYVEPLTCVSCHMPFATRSVSSASAAVVGPTGRLGDIRTHIFRIDTGDMGFSAMFVSDGSRVRTDSTDKASITVDFVCLRCHNGIGGAFELSLESAADIADRMHEIRIP